MPFRVRHKDFPGNPYISDSSLLDFFPIELNENDVTSLSGFQQILFDMILKSSSSTKYQIIKCDMAVYIFFLRAILNGQPKVNFEKNVVFLGTWHNAKIVFEHIFKDYFWLFWYKILKQLSPNQTLILKPKFFSILSFFTIVLQAWKKI